MRLKNLGQGTLQTLKETCGKLMAYNSSNTGMHHKIKLFPDRYLKALQHCNDVITLLTLLTPYLSW